MRKVLVCLDTLVCVCVHVYKAPWINLQGQGTGLSGRQVCQPGSLAGLWVAGIGRPVRCEPAPHRLPGSHTHRGKVLPHR